MTFVPLPLGRRRHLSLESFLFSLKSFCSDCDIHRLLFCSTRTHFFFFFSSKNINGFLAWNEGNCSKTKEIPPTLSHRVTNSNPFNFLLPGLTLRMANGPCLLLHVFTLSTLSIAKHQIVLLQIHQSTGHSHYQYIYDDCLTSKTWAHSNCLLIPISSSNESSASYFISNCLPFYPECTSV